MVSVDVKHHVYLLTMWAYCGWDMEGGGAGRQSQVLPQCFHAIMWFRAETKLCIPWPCIWHHANLSLELTIQLMWSVRNNPPLWSSSESTLQYVLSFHGTVGKTLSYQEKSPSRRSSKNPLGRHATRLVTSSLSSAPLTSELPVTRSSGRKHTTRGVFPLSPTKTTGPNYYLSIRYPIASL